MPDNFAVEDDFGPLTLSYLAEFSVGGALAWVRTDYFGSSGAQSHGFMSGSSMISARPVATSMYP